MADANTSRPDLDPAEINSTIAYLSSRNDTDYAEALADCIMDPEPVEVAAFRSSQLAYRSLVACRYLIDHANTTIAYRKQLEESGQTVDDMTTKWKQRATARFRDRVGMERRLLEQIIAGDAARNGRISNAPSAQGRALRRLKQLHLDEFQRLKDEEQAKIDAETVRRGGKPKGTRAERKAGGSLPSRKPVNDKLRVFAD